MAVESWGSGTHSPKSINQRARPLPHKNMVIYYSVFLDTYSNCAFSKIVRFKCPNSEVELIWGERLCLNPFPKQNVVETPLAIIK